MASLGERWVARVPSRSRREPGRDGMQQGSHERNKSAQLGQGSPHGPINDRPSIFLWEQQLFRMKPTNQRPDFAQMVDPTAENVGGLRWLGLCSVLLS